jgi:hypothetical protein
MANYEDLKYSGLTGSAALANVVIDTTNAISVSTIMANNEIAIGDVVMLNADSTVSSITNALPQEIPRGTSHVISPISTTKFPASAFDPANPNNMLIMACDGSVLVVTLDADGVVTAIGTPITLNSNYSARYGEVKFDPHVPGRFAIVMADNSVSSGYPRIILGSLSGLTVTLGSTNTLFNAYMSDAPAIDWDPHATNRMYGCSTLWSSSNNNTYGTNVNVVTLSNNTITSTISVNTRYRPNNYAAGSGNTITACPIVPNRMFYMQQDGAQSYKATMWVATTTGTNILFPSSVTAGTGNGNNWKDTGSRQFRVLIDTDNSTAILTKGIMFYANTYYDLNARSFTVSATNAISMGPELTVYSGVVSGFEATLNPTNTSQWALTASTSGINGVMMHGSFDGSTITYGGVEGIDFHTYATTDAVNAGTIAFRPETSQFTSLYVTTAGSYSAIGGTLVYGTANFDADLVLGISKSAAMPTEYANVVVDGGIADGMVGLIQGKDYFIGNDGTMTYVNTATNVRVGKAVSSTSIKIGIAAVTADEVTAIQTELSAVSSMSSTMTLSGTVLTITSGGA